MFEMSKGRAGDGTVKKRNHMFAIYTFQCTLHHTPECQHNHSVSRQRPETQFTEGQGNYTEEIKYLFPDFSPSSVS